MTKISISNGAVHKVPSYIERKICSSSNLIAVWEDITPLARSEWICWIDSAKQDKTKERRLQIMSENLLKGKRRPCCWAGCKHRTKS